MDGIYAFDHFIIEPYFYHSITIPYMDRAFGVTERFIDNELSIFISARRLDCKIDKVGGIVETNWPDSVGCPKKNPEPITPLGLFQNRSMERHNYLIYTFINKLFKISIPNCVR